MTHTQTTIYIGMYNIRSTCVSQYGQLRTGTLIKLKSVKTVFATHITETYCSMFRNAA